MGNSRLGWGEGVEFRKCGVWSVEYGVWKMNERAYAAKVLRDVVVRPSLDREGKAMMAEWHTEWSVCMLVWRR